MSDTTIKSVIGRSVWDSRGRPTVEADVILVDGSVGRAIAPAGASTGSGEALDLRDGSSAFGGFGVSGAVANVNRDIATALLGKDASDQAGCDAQLVDLDGTPDRSRLGGNAMIATSMALAHATARSRRLPLWQSVQTSRQSVMPVPEIQIFGGGAHASGQMDLQDFMIVPFGADSFRQATEWVAEVYLAAGSIMRSAGMACGVADEGGYWPSFPGNESAIEALVKAIELAGFSVTDQIGLSLDIAASQFFRDGKYVLKREGRQLSSQEWFAQLADWMHSYPIKMIEDPFDESDFESHAAFTSAFGTQAQIVGDDLLVTKLARIDTAAQAKACNTLLCKPNQVGTLSEARTAFERSRALGWNCVLSARSGETEDVTIAHLAVGWGVRQFKVGSFSRSERMAKWNEMLRIEEALGKSARYAGAEVFGH